jgi:hypothetical protein
VLFKPKHKFAETFNVIEYRGLGNCDIDVLVFCHCFRIMSLKFLKFERVQNSVVKFQIAQKWKREVTKLNEMGQNYHSQ